MGAGFFASSQPTVGLTISQPATNTLTLTLALTLAGAYNNEWTHNDSPGFTSLSLPSSEELACKQTSGRLYKLTPLRRRRRQ